MEVKHSNTQTIEYSIRQIFNHIGENPDRPGLIGTPDRIVRMWEEIFRGYDPSKKPKITTFKNNQDNISYLGIIVDTGNYYSMCEHHMLPFFGKYWFAYIPHPKGQVIGISKIGRVVDYCAARLQIQERLVSDVLDVIWEALSEQTYPPLAMGLIMEGEHLCKSMRGVKKLGKMVSSDFRGESSGNVLQLKRELTEIFNSDRK